MAMANKQHTSRRRYLELTGASAAVTALAGCIGGIMGGGDTIRWVSRGGTTQDAERELWEEWSDESGTTVEHQEVADDTEMMNLVSENPGEIDFLNPSSWGYAYEAFEFDGELLTELDVGEIPNYEEVVQDEWQESPLVADNPKAVFYYVSTQGIGWNTDQVDEITSWEEIKDDQFDDAVTLFDSAPARFGNSCANLGLETEEAAEDDDLFEEVLEEIEAQNVNAFNYWTTGDEYMRLMREERAAVAEAWGGRVDVLEADDYPVNYTHTEDGCVTWSNGFAIAEDSENKEACYDAINW